MSQNKKILKEIFNKMSSYKNDIKYYIPSAPMIGLTANNFATQQEKEIELAVDSDEIDAISEESNNIEMEVMDTTTNEANNIQYVERV